MKYRFIEEHRSQWPVRLMCRVLQISPGGYYSWRDRPASARQQRQEVLTTEIEVIHQEFKERYGSPRIREELQARGQRLYCAPRTGHENGLGELDGLMILNRFWKPQDGSQHRPSGFPSWG